MLQWKLESFFIPTLPTHLSAGKGKISFFIINKNNIKETFLSWIKNWFLALQSRQSFGHVKAKIRKKLHVLFFWILMLIVQLMKWTLNSSDVVLLKPLYLTTQVRIPALFHIGTVIWQNKNNLKCTNDFISGKCFFGTRIQNQSFMLC